MGDSLRILLTADPELPVPPRLYGGIERVVSLLADGLSARGHDVMLLAHRDSQIAGRLQPYPSAGGRWGAVRNAAAIARAVASFKPSVVHSFGRLATLAAVLPARVPKLMSYQRAVTERSVRWGRRLAGDSLTFVSCSHRLISGRADRSTWRVVHNAVDVSRYTFAPQAGSTAPLVFLGRIEHIKGTHVAIDVARRAGRQLVLAGNVPLAHQTYFDEQVRPHIDGKAVVYLGPVDDARKNALLSSAAALLMPVLWEEPFGIVMAEALACGTPVIGLARGAVPEVVRHGVTGFVCETPEEMTQAVSGVEGLSRRECRDSAEQRFSQAALVDGYTQVYRDVLARAGSRARVPREATL
jgi:glycosyltransferase involved in cell wall biosynthesis